MKKLSKTLLAIAAVSAASMAMTASAMAMTADYANGVVTLSGIEDTGASQTLLIVPEGTETATEENIYQIDQKDAVDGVNGSFNGEEIKLDVSKLTEGATYEVRIGGTTAGTIQRDTFTVPGGTVDPGDEQIVILIGDATGDGMVEMLDASAIASYSVGTSNSDNANVNNAHTVVDGLDGVEVVRIGDATMDGIVEMLDASAVASFSVGTSTTDNANVNTSVTVEKTAIAE